MRKLIKDLTEAPVSSLIAFLKMLIFLPVFFSYRGKRDATAIEFRQSKPDSDTLPLLQAALANKPGKKILIIADKPKVAAPYVTELNEFLKTDLIEVTSLSSALKRSRTVFLIDNPNSERLMMRGARFFLRDQKYYRIFHGLITKKTPTEQKFEDYMPSRRGGRAFDGVLCQNWIESYRRAYFSGIPVRKTIRVGYPRFYRAPALKDKSAPLLLTEEAQSLIQKLGFKIMYAPTRSGSLPALSGFDEQVLLQWLEEHNAYLYLKTHVLTKQIQGFENLGDRVVDLSKVATIGSLDILSCMDALITDTSSIMMEGFALDLPVIHSINEDPTVATAHDVIAFEEHIALPGMRAYDFNELIEKLNCAKAGDYSNQFAQDVWGLVPEKDIEQAFERIIR